MTPALRKAVKLSMYASESSLSQRFDDLVSVGLDGVEIGVDATSPTAEIRAASATSGLQVPTLVAAGTFTHSLASADRSERQQAAAAVLGAIDVAHTVGAGVVMVSPGWDRAELHPDATAALVRDELAPAVVSAHDAGVTIAVENLWNDWLSSPTDLAAFVDSFENDHVGVLFDSGNAARFSPPQHWVEVLGRRIVRLDVKDYKRAWARNPATVYADDDSLQAAWGTGGPWGALDALPFEGDVDWPLLTAALRRSSYDGWCCAEHGTGDREWISGFVAILERFSDLCTGEGANT